MNEIEDLQVRVSFQDDALQELNLNAVRQQNELDALRRELLRLQGRLLELETNQPGADGETASEIPPHY